MATDVRETSDAYRRSDKGSLGDLILVNGQHYESTYNVERTAGHIS